MTIKFEPHRYAIFVGHKCCYLCLPELSEWSEDLELMLSMLKDKGEDVMAAGNMHRKIRQCAARTKQKRVANARAILLSTCVFALASCGAPTEMSDMRSAMSERLALGVNSETTSTGEPIPLGAGFVPALRAAVMANEGYLGAVALEREALGQVGVADSVRRPQLSASANIGGVRETGPAGTTTTGVAGGVNVSQLVYDGGEAASSVNRATALALAAQAGRVAQSNDIALNAARAWIDLWQFTERLRLMRARTSEMDTLVGQIERMATNGMLDRAALDSARRQIVDITLEETRLEASRAEAQVMFNRFFRATPAQPGRPADLVTAQKARNLAQDWQNAPALQRQTAELFAAQAAVETAQSAFRPKARLQGGARSPMQRGDATDLTIGLSVEYSFSDGGRRQRQLDSAEARAEATNAQLTDAQRALEAEMAGAITRLESIDRSIPLVARKLSLSQSEAETARSQLMTGQSNLRQLVEAEIETYRAQDQQIALQAERQILLLTIAARTGALNGLIGLED
jgi:adhesin transport system outer membrane protein